MDTGEESHSLTFSFAVYKFSSSISEQHNIPALRSPVLLQQLRAADGELPALQEHNTPEGQARLDLKGKPRLDTGWSGWARYRRVRLG